MRNSEARRYARWCLAAAALLAGFVAAVYARNVWLARQAEKKAPPAVPPTVEQRSNEFSFSKVEGQRTIYTVKASRTTEFKGGGRNLLEDVDISVYGKTGERDDRVVTKACDFISTTGKIACAGEVEISLQASTSARASANAIHVKTSAVTFDRDSGKAQTAEPVSYHWPGGDGEAVGLNYDSNSGTLRLMRNVELNLSTPPTSPKAENSVPSQERAVHLTSDSIAFQRDTRVVTMEGNVQGRQAKHELSCDELSLTLDASFHAQHFTASGHPQLRDSTARAPIALSADEITAEMNPDGSVRTVAATGNVRGRRTTSDGENGIEAGRVQLDLVIGKNVPRVVAAGNGVTLSSVSTAANGGTGRLESDALEMYFSNDSSPGRTWIESVHTLAPARAEWRNTSVVNGKPVQQTMQAAGEHMVLSFGEKNQLQQLVSSGVVQVTRKLGDAPEEITTSRELTAKFDHAGEWSVMDQTGDVRFRDGLRSGQADHARVDRSSDTLALEGSAVLTDSTTRTSARSALFSRASNTLRADGHVLTTELQQGASRISNFAPDPANITAEHLTADTAKGHAVYSGHGRLWQGSSVIEAETIELDSPSHTLVAKGSVHGVFPQAAWTPKPGHAEGQFSDQTQKRPSEPAQDRTTHSTSLELAGQRTPQPQLGRVWGELLTYWETESRARIEQRARADSEQGSIQADQIDLFFSDADAENGGKQLSRAVATGDVAVRQQDRRGTSNRAEYTASEGKFVLSEGKPTVYDSSGDSTTGRQLTFYFADDRIVVDSTDGPKTLTLHPVEK